MSQFEEEIAKYTNDLKTKCGIDSPNVELLTKIAKNLGPSIYNADSSIVATSDKGEMASVKKFLTEKLGLADDEALTVGINDVIDMYGKSNPRKYRAVMYYLLAHRFNKQTAIA